MTAQSEFLHQENQTLQRQLRDRDEEIARLREELSRAAVTITTLRGRLDEVVTQCSTTHTLTRRDAQRAVENARRTLATPSPLSDAAQEVLEAATATSTLCWRGGIGRRGEAMKIVRIPGVSALAHPETFRERLALMIRPGWRRNRGVLSGFAWWSIRPPRTGRGGLRP